MTLPVKVPLDSASRLAKAIASRLPKIARNNGVGTHLDIRFIGVQPGQVQVDALTRASDSRNCIRPDRWFINL